MAPTSRMLVALIKTMDKMATTMSSSSSEKPFFWRNASTSLARSMPIFGEDKTGNDAAILVGEEIQQ